MTDDYNTPQGYLLILHNVLNFPQKKLMRASYFDLANLKANKLQLLQTTHTKLPKSHKKFPTLHKYGNNLIRELGYKYLSLEIAVQQKLV